MFKWKVTVIDDSSNEQLKRITVLKSEVIIKVSKFHCNPCLALEQKARSWVPEALLGARTRNLYYAASITIVIPNTSE